MIKVYAPASIGNINVGFDSLGIALHRLDNGILGDYISILPNKKFELIQTGSFVKDLPKHYKNNIIFHCWLKFCKKINKTIPVKVILEKNVPISSGLGSSACSIVAFLKAINIFCNNPLNHNELIMLMGELEGLFSGNIHYDNIVPCYLGGMKLILIMDDINIQNIPFFKNWFWVIAYPGVELSTYNSRKILPNYYKRDVCIKHSQYLSGFIHASHIKQEKLALKLMKDFIAEPYRKKIIPEFDQVINKAQELGSLNYGIAGSGPTLFYIFNNLVHAQNMVKWLEHHYIKNHKGFVYICVINTIGTIVMDMET
ncbi:homoserine kinase [Enterobacteriaceae endosymbiont of Neohaemonia nigricornis]|uniref:homoserine kinase n=1 Tax=Enterobacteriaceae endosymbiont of Neohaemonia nigricornis TaxID=2675792 RepID=UPI001448CF90|nr:homoserine kinase [Enterobacteriaceae endosymbiont of Neohaemonia nigricornis]QJC30556.1 homoserine kinase [Enterobacteriaceae endosymbiont of Neohaemonia nigricornis]